MNSKLMGREPLAQRLRAWRAAALALGKHIVEELVAPPRTYAQSDSALSCPCSVVEALEPANFGMLVHALDELPDGLL